MIDTPLSRHQHPVDGLAILLPQGRATEVHGCVRKCMVHRQHHGRDAHQRHRPDAHTAVCLLPQPIDRHAYGYPLRSLSQGAATIRTWPQQMARTVWRTENQWSARDTCALQYGHVPRLPAIQVHARHGTVSKLIASAMQGSYCGGLHEPRLDCGRKGLQGRHTKAQHDLCDMRSGESVCRKSSSVSVSDIRPCHYSTNAHL